MYCNNCGIQIKDGEAFCHSCGAKQVIPPVITAPEAPKNKQSLIVSVSPKVLKIAVGAIASIIVVIIAVVAIKGNSPQKKIVGNWEVSSSNTTSLYGYPEYGIHYNENGTGTWEGTSITWIIHDDTLSVAGFWGNAEFHIKFKGNKMYLAEIYRDGSIDDAVIYEKVK